MQRRATGGRRRHVDASPDSDTTMTHLAGAHEWELEDTEVWSAEPDLNYGTADHMSVDDSATSLVRCDLESIPASATVLSAVLTVRTDDEASESGGTITVFRLREAWQEGDESEAPGTCNWQMRTAEQVWSGAGATPPSRDTAPLGVFAPDAEDSAFSVAIPPATVRDWIEDPETNHGLALVGSPELEHVHLRTRDSGDGWSTLAIDLAPAP